MKIPTHRVELWVGRVRFDIKLHGPGHPHANDCRYFLTGSRKMASRGAEGVFLASITNSQGKEVGGGRGARFDKTLRQMAVSVLN